MKKAKKRFISSIVIAAFAVLFCVFFIKPVLTKQPVFIFRHAAFVVKTSSMEPSFKTNSLVVIKKVPKADLRQGDVIAFRSDALGGRLAMHRISRIAADGIYTKGDGNTHEDNQAINQTDFVGKCVYYSDTFSGFLGAIGTTKGFVLLVIFPALAALSAYMAVKIIGSKPKNKNNDAYE